MHILVTGGSGRLGEWVVRELRSPRDRRPPHTVTVFDLHRPAVPAQYVDYICGDVRDLGQVLGVAGGVDVIVHLAAIKMPGRTPNEVTFGSNVLGSFNVHEAAWRLGIRRVVSTSSEAALGWDYCDRPPMPLYLPMDEDHPLWPQDAYGLSKAAGELIARSYSARGGLETVVLRPAPIKVPAQMDAMQRNNGDATIKFNLFNYVDIRDLAEAYRLAVERPAVGGVVLFLCADDSAVGEPLCTVFPRLMPATAALAAPLTGSRPSVLNTRAKGILGWQPRHSWRPPSTIY